jgi:hypothetical protein
MPETTLAGLGILFVEDESLLRRQLTAHLEGPGAGAVACHHCLSAGTESSD